MSNVIVKINEHYEIECLKFLLFSCQDDISDQFHFTFLTNDSLIEDLKLFLDKIIQGLKLTNLKFEVTSNSVEESDAIILPVTSIVLPNSLKENKQVIITPSIFEQKINLIQTTCQVPNEIWVLQKEEDMLPEHLIHILHACLSKTYQSIEIAETVLQDIQQRLKSESKSEIVPEEVVEVTE